MQVFCCLLTAAFALLYTLTAQLAQIRKFKYAKVICENADYIPMIQPNVFHHPLSVYIAKLVTRNSADDEIARHESRILGTPGCRRRQMVQFGDADSAISY